MTNHVDPVNGWSLETPSPETPSCAGIAQWEKAYIQFETPEEEVAKFRRRLVWFGAPGWPKDARIVELFCGRGGGLEALAQLGFNRLEGVDLSAQLIGEYRGAGDCYVADCRQLPFADASRDILIVQGGLHHLGTIPDDLDRVLEEAARVLVPGGSLVVVEPWLTPFLRFVHFCCGRRLARRVWPKLDALATMIEHERVTYEQWLGASTIILDSLRSSFTPIRQRVRWGKLLFQGRSR